MPSRYTHVTTTPYIIAANASRTVLIIQNKDTDPVDYIYVGEDIGSLDLLGIRVAGQGGSLTLRAVDGEEPQKVWYLQAVNDAPCIIIELFGDVDTGQTPTPTPTPTPLPERIGWL